MSARDVRPGLVALQQRWDQWTALVEAAARKRRGWLSLDVQMYERLHAELLAECRHVLATAKGAERAQCQRLEALARPWLTPATLELTDRQILLDLVGQCCRLGEKLGGRRQSFRPLLLPLTLVVLAGAALALVIVAGDRLEHLAAGPLEEAPVLFRLALRELRRIPGWVVLGSAIFLVIAVLIARTVRS
jgi:hypothetical protein